MGSYYGTDNPGITTSEMGEELRLYVSQSKVVGI